MDTRLEVDGIPIDELLPPPTQRVKRKEPNTILDAETKLKDGMKTAIQPNNKGFQMLMKLGFDPNAKHSEPLQIELRKGRGGLGHFEMQQAEEAEIKHKKHEEESKRRKEAKYDLEQFQKRQRIIAASRRVSGQLFSMLKLAYQLIQEYAHDNSESNMIFSACIDDPPPILANEAVKMALNSSDVNSELHQLLANMTISTKEHHHFQLSHYLREDFNYCFWCAVQYESKESMEQNCPGNTEQAHLESIMPHDEES